MRSPWTNKLGVFAIAVVVPLGLGVLAASCGDTPCEELSDVCDQCRDATYLESCRARVHEDVEEVCNTQLSTFEQACPATTATATTTHTGTTSTGTGTTSSSTSSTSTVPPDASGGGGAGGGGGTGGTGGAGGTGG